MSDAAEDLEALLERGRDQPPEVVDVRALFPRGARVRLSPAGRAALGRMRKGLRGTVRGWSRDGWCVWVLPEGITKQHSGACIHYIFLELAPAP